VHFLPLTVAAHAAAPDFLQKRVAPALFVSRLREWWPWDKAADIAVVVEPDLASTDQLLAQSLPGPLDSGFCPRQGNAEMFGQGLLRMSFNVTEGDCQSIIGRQLGEYPWQALA
jgi:hypothetical protein